MIHKQQIDRLQALEATAARRRAAILQDWLEAGYDLLTSEERVAYSRRLAVLEDGELDDRPLPGELQPLDLIMRHHPSLAGHRARVLALMLGRASRPAAKAVH